MLSRNRSAVASLSSVRLHFVLLLAALVLYVMVGSATADVEVTDSSVDQELKLVEPGASVPFLIGYEFLVDTPGPEETDVDLTLNTETGGWTHEFTGWSSYHVDSDGWLYTTVNVTAPVDAEADETFEVQVVMNNTNGSNPQAVSFTAGIDVEFGVFVEGIQPGSHIYPGKHVDVPIDVRNDGNIADKIRLEVDLPDGWSVSWFPKANVDLDPGQNSTITARLTTDSDSLYDANYVNITGYSSGSNETDYDNVAIYIAERFDCELSIVGDQQKDVIILDRNKSVTYELLVRNTGNRRTELDLNTFDEDSTGWNMLVNLTTVDLAPNETAVVSFTILAERSNVSVDHLFSVNATMENGSVSNTLTYLLSAVSFMELYQFELHVLTGFETVDAANEETRADFEFRIHNVGTQQDDYIIEDISVPSKFTVGPLPNVYDVDSDHNHDYNFYVDIPTDDSDIDEGVYTVTIRVRSNSNTSIYHYLNVTLEITEYTLEFDVNDIDVYRTINPDDGETSTQFSFEIVNTGTRIDDYRIEASGYSTNKFKSIPAQNAYDLAQDESKIVFVNVSYAPSKDAKDLEANDYEFTIRVRSNADPSIYITKTLTLDVEPFEGIQIHTPLAVKDIEADEDNKFEIKLTNTGNADEYVELSITEMTPVHADWVSFYTDQDLLNQITDDVTVPYDETIRIFMKIFFTRDQALSEEDFVPEDSNSNKITLKVQASVPSGDNEEQQFTGNLKRVVSYSVDIPNREKTITDPDKGESVSFDIKVRNEGIEPEDFQLIINEVPQFLKAEFEGGGSVVTINDLETTETETLNVEIDTNTIFLLPVDKNPFVINMSVKPQHAPSGYGVPTDAKKRSFDLKVTIEPIGVPEFDITGEETQEVTPGKNVTYALKFTNEGNDVEDLTIGITSNDELFGKINGQTQITIDDIHPGHSKTIPYVVNISRSDAEEREYDMIEETITVYSSITDESVSRTIETTIKEIKYEVEVVFTGKSKDGDPGDKLSFGFSVENTGDADDDIEVRIQETEDPGSNINPGEIGWVELTGFNKTSTSTLTLDDLTPRKLIPMDLIINIPSDFKQAEAGIYSYNVSVKSTNDANTIVSNEVRVEVNEQYDLELTLTPSKGTRELDPSGTDGDERIDYTIRLKNLGNSKDRITVATERLGSDLKAEFDGQTQYNTPELDPDESASVTLEVEGSTNYDEGTYTFTVLARGSGDAEQREDLTVRVLKGDLRIGDITIDNEADLEKDDDTVVTVKLENRGTSEISDIDIIFEVNNKEIDTKTGENVPENDTIEVSFDWDNIGGDKQKIVIKTEDPGGDFQEDKTKSTTIYDPSKDDQGAYESLFSSNPAGPIIIVFLIAFVIIMLLYLMDLGRGGGGPDLNLTEIHGPPFSSPSAGRAPPAPEGSESGNGTSIKPTKPLPFGSEAANDEGRKKGDDGSPKLIMKERRAPPPGDKGPDGSPRFQPPPYNPPPGYQPKDTGTKRGSPPPERSTGQAKTKKVKKVRTGDVTENTSAEELERMLREMGIEGK